jgi:hypothetical protein
MTKATAKNLMARIALLRSKINAGTMPSTEEHGELATISADEFDWHFMCMEQTIEAASETPEERKAREEREEADAQRAEDDAGYWRGLGV